MEPSSGWESWRRTSEPAVLAAFAPLDADGFPARPPRFPLTLPARFRCAGAMHDIRLVDLSCGGAKIAHAGPAAVDQIGLIGFVGLPEPVLGNVRWIAGNRLGFRFSQPIPSERLESVLHYAARTASRS